MTDKKKINWKSIAVGAAVVGAISLVNGLTREARDPAPATEIAPYRQAAREGFLTTCYANAPGDSTTKYYCDCVLSEAEKVITEKEFFELSLALMGQGERNLEVAAKADVLAQVCASKFGLTVTSSFSAIPTIAPTMEQLRPGMVAGCMAEIPNKENAETFCNCFVDEVFVEMTVEQFTQLGQSFTQGGEPPPEFLKVSEAAGKACAQHIE